jgi:L-alanine-DL-glutamate epimerase-like enolase superfamily enzyme
MRITDIAFTRCSLGKVERPFYTSTGVPFSEKTFSFLEVKTDEGVAGFAPGGAAAAGMLEQLKARVVGEDPLDPARLWRRLFGGPRVVKGPDLAGIGAVDNALWDLRGKILGLPVYRLLGGFRDRVPVYLSGGFYQDGKDKKALAEECAGYLELGYRAVKIRVGHPGFSLRDDLARVEAVRAAIGPDVELMVDANSGFATLTHAARFIRAAEAYELSWVEEPTWPDDLDGAAELCRTFDTPIAQGEREHTRWGCRELIDRRAADILQPDPEWCGGLTEWVRIAAYASAHHLPVAPHGTHLVGAHAAAAVDNGLWAEGCDEGFFPWHRQFVEQYPMRDGQLVLPSAPGFGIDLDRELIERTRVA